MADKPRLGEMLRMLGAGAPRKTADKAVRAQKKKKKKLDSIMSEIRSTRGR